MAAIAFSDLLANTALTPGKLSVDIPQDWMQGRSVFGGLQVALALRAMRTLVPDLPLRTLQTTFVAPAPAGRFAVSAAVLRSGKSATHVEARIGAGETLAIVLGVFGAPRASAVTHLPEQPPVADPAPVAFDYVSGRFPDFTQHFAVRWLRGRPPFTGDRARQHVVEVTLKDRGPAGEAHVVALADFIPPVALSHLGAPAPGSTLTWMLEFLAERVDHLGLAGWRVDADMVAALDGYTNQSVLLWSPLGEPIAISRQSMLVFG